MMQENGVHYVRYITAGDDRVRPEHQLRNNKIYRMEDAPWLGEYNCRCTFVPADREVKQGAYVTLSQAEIIPYISNNIDVIDSLRKSKKSNIPKILTTSSNKTKQQPKEEPKVSTATLWQPFTEDEIKTMSLNDIKKNIANRWGCEGFKIYKNMKKVDIDIIRHNVLAADKVIRDFKIPNLISRFYYGGTDSDFMGTIPGHNKKPAIITFDAVAVKLNSMKSAYKGLLVKHDCPSSTNWMDVLSHEIGYAVEWYLVRKKYPNSAKEQINSWKKCGCRIPTQAGGYSARPRTCR